MLSGKPAAPRGDWIQATDGTYVKKSSVYLLKNGRRTAQLMKVYGHSKMYDNNGATYRYAVFETEFDCLSWNRQRKLDATALSAPEYTAENIVGKLPFSKEWDSYREGSIGDYQWRAVCRL
ncbi:hypothetical protein D0T90_10475 [Neisseria animalis]|uniref:Surface-adhesin protein E-like domain-containing protein n=2 Tax=Neisseria animalis TaxID=492 RepID=A0A5P3MTB4_NEIAN|nr:hypothetical protein D0T90_10475 [Neisseria animalis]ROW31558.1 hypothetical protein CGZ60_09610 [Neisseria animalis]